MKCIFLFFAVALSIAGYSQVSVDTLKPVEEDFSMYSDVVEAPTNIKVYASQKILGLSPSKLISLGFDFAGANNMDVTAIGSFSSNTADISRNTGVRFAANFPVISNTKMILNVGVNYLDFKYSIDKSINTNHPFVNALSQNGLHSYGINATLFKPFNAKFFGILQLASDHNSAGKIDQFYSDGLKFSGAAIFGKKPHDRLQYGFGISQSYRGGARNYFPVVLFNYTFQNRKWGIEMLLPARANVRYTFNARQLLFAGYELEGNSYFMSPMINDYNLGYKNLQLHRSEIRPRLTYEFSIYKFFWMSIQAGYRIGFRFNVDDVDYNDSPLVMENKLSGTYYFNISLNLVSP
jgi:hypothetical protein